MLAGCILEMDIFEFLAPCASEALLQPFASCGFSLARPYII